MFTWDPENHTTWDVCQSVQPAMHDVNQGVCNTLIVPITIISNAEPQSLQNHLSGPVAALSSK